VPPFSYEERAAHIAGMARMKEASFQDAVVIGQRLNVSKDEVWKIIKGVAYCSLTELSFLVHRTFKSESKSGESKPG
jgi:hypothetical protein